MGPFVKTGMTVVEPGCGFGYVSLSLSKMVGPEGRVISVDVEPRAAARLKQKAEKKGLADRMNIRTCESYDLGLGCYEGQADLVVVIHTLHEFEDLPGFLAQAAKLLKPSGRMLVVEPRSHVIPEQFSVELECCRLA